MLNGHVFLSCGSKVKFSHPNSPAFHRERVLGLDLLCITKLQLVKQTGALLTMYSPSRLFSFKRTSLNQHDLSRRQGALLLCWAPLLSFCTRGGMEKMWKCFHAVPQYNSYESSTHHLYYSTHPNPLWPTEKNHGRMHSCHPNVSVFPFHSWCGIFSCSLSTFALNLGRWTARLSQLTFPNHLGALGGFPLHILITGISVSHWDWGS